MKRAVIFANGNLRDYTRILPLLETRDYIMAADGGVKHIHRLKLKPSLVIGDLDSVAASDLDIVEHQQTEILRFDVDKDETDLELAIRTAKERGFRSIMIVAGLGGRLDQTLANIFLLLHEDFQNCEIHFEDGFEEVCLLKDSIEIEGSPEDIISLIPIKGDCVGVTTEGLKYPLDHETLYAYKTRGISNEMKTTRATITIEDGVALCVHTRN